MQLVRHLPARFDADRGSAVAIGNFDGIHRGHQALIAEAVRHAPALRPVVLCFEPLPATLFRPERPVPRVMKLRDRLRVCEQLGVKTLAPLRFDRAFSEQSPETFVRRVLVDGLRARHVIVGADFRFGHRAAGDVVRLRALGAEHGFEVTTVNEVRDEHGRISSTRLRQALSAGELDHAESLLGRPYAISGRVIRGNQLGRTLGFATANLRVAEPPALSGILAARISGAGLDKHPAVVSLGRRPTVAGRDWLLEAHLFDFSGNLYGRHLTVEFAGFIRHEAHFDSLQEMTAAMHGDARRARAILAGVAV
ncbi:MAG: bifunctional riboflavin kinase/FAD synthetase [Wenzhouxiangellaceae bacterium]|nr:bifunctional riboflavin kinase/FAD synthetase [Wenzhouxiangellaceae bacterium]